MDGGGKRMGRRIARLSPLEIRRLVEKGRSGHYHDGAGLYLKVSSPGAASWTFRFKRERGLREMGLGPVHVLGVGEARERALAARKLLLDGIDPIEHRKAQRLAAKLEAARSITFRAAAVEYMAQREEDWSDKHRLNWSSAMERFAYPVLGELPLSMIGTAEILRAIEPAWTTRRETMARLSARIAAVFDYSKSRGYVAGDNPASRSILKYALPRRATQVRHMPALPYVDVPAFMRELRQLEGVTARAVEFAILTCARSGEVLGARWDEIDLGNRVWTISAKRMKAGREHRVPLSARAVEILELMAASRESDFLFPGRRWHRPLGASATWKQVIELRPGVTLHGFRSSFRDWAAERTNFPNEVAEMALAHRVGSAIELAYRRGDQFEKRRRLAEAWAGYCGAEPSQVVTMPRRA